MPLTTVSPGMLDTTAQYYSFKNRIINGGMVIDQRNAGASVTPTSSAYVLDRWQAGLSQASKYSVQQNAGAVTPPVGYINYLGVTSLSAYSVLSTDNFFLQQPIEGLNVADLGWGSAAAQSVTLSFWVRSSLTGTFGGTLVNSANNYSYPFTFSITAANTWEYKTVTVAGPTAGTWLTTNGVGVRLNFGLGCGSNNNGTAGAWAASNFTSATGATSVVGTNGATFYITGVQLEKGSTATSFDYRPYGTELALCQRYFEKSFPQATAPAQNSGEKAALLYVNSSDGGSLAGFTPFKVTKRASPTIVGYNPSAANSNFSNGGTANFHVVDDTGLGGYTTTLTGARATINWTASAEL